MRSKALIFSVIYLLLYSFQVQSKEFETLESFASNYPIFEQGTIESEAKKELNKMGFKLAKIGDQITIRTKIGGYYKGKYNGKNYQDNIEIGFSRIAWVDIPDDKRYLFSEEYLEKKTNAFIADFVSEEKAKYEAKRSAEIRKYELELLAAPNNLVTAIGEILYNFSIEQKDEWGAKISHNNGKLSIKYEDLPSAERGKIKSGFNVSTNSGKTYNNIQMISQTPASITFHDENGDKTSLRFKDLATVVQQYFNYSKVAEDAYWKAIKEEKEKTALARAKKTFWANVDKIIMDGSIKNSRFKTFQVMEYGSLCSFGKYSSYYRDYRYDGNTFFLYGANNSFVANNEEYQNDLYYTGTYIYTTTQGADNTVQSYAFDKALARKLIVWKYNLQEPGIRPKANPTPNNNITPTLNDNQPQIKGFGSGFIITSSGHIITNQHVIEGANKIKVKTSKNIYDAKIIEVDKQNDLAIIKIEGKFNPVSFSKDRQAQLGETVFAIGFPRPDLQGVSPKVTKGVVSGLKGMKDNIREYQIDAAIQLGNSGGPLADASGNVIGVIVGKLNDAYVMKSHGDIAQNVNYAIKKAYVFALLDSNPQIANSIIEKEDIQIPFEKAVEKVNQSTVLIIIY